MRSLKAFVLSCLLVFLPFVSRISAQGMGIEDLLIPEASPLNEITGGNQPLSKKPQEGSSVDELLGPEDNFPFLPDNHRDSGTGKFNSY